jgi:hypothetical protein
MASKSSPKAAPAPKTPSAPAPVNYGYTAANPSFTYSSPVVTPATKQQVGDFTAVENKTAGLTGANAIPMPTGYIPPQQVDPAAKAVADSEAAKRKDAFALLQDTFNQYGLGELSSTIQQFMQQNVGPEEASLRLKTDTSINPATGKAYNAPYVARFAGNVARRANGLNALIESDYIRLENEFSNLMTQYGVGKGSATNLANQAQFATLIGNDVSTTELNSRLDLAVTQVQNADPTVMATLKQFYPGISNTGLMAYFLSPEETLPVLQQQTQAAEIGAAAVKQGLTTDVTSATALARAGVTQAQAQTGYGRIAEVLPTATKLSQIYGAQTGINYNQAEAEKQYLLNSGAAALEQQKLTAAEQAQFAGKSGIVGANAASGYSGSLGKSIQGKF